MAKPAFTDADDALLAELGVEAKPKKVVKRSKRDERIIAGFEEIERFYQEHGRLPQHGEDKDIFERIYAVRLDKLRESEACRDVLAEFDSSGILTGTAPTQPTEDMDDEALLEALGVEPVESDITRLKHVKSQAEKRAAEEIANRTPCEDFDKFSPLFGKVKDDLKTGAKKSVPFKEDNSVEQGDFFIVGGQIAYVAEVGEPFRQATNGVWEARLRVIYDNATESNLLRRSLVRALHKDEAGRRIIDDYAGPLFSDEAEDGDVESGTIYVLRSNSQDPFVAEHRTILHKIGVTGGDIGKRIANAENDPTFLMAGVEVVATYQLSNINRVRLERLLHRFFEPARVEVSIKDRFGKAITPREWFLVPRIVVDEAIEKIKDGTITRYRYAPELGGIVAV